MSPTFVTSEVEPQLDWIALSDALAAGHERGKPEVRDSLITRGQDTVLSRMAWIDGLGIAVKTATIFPGNPKTGRPTIGGGVALYDDATGALEAIFDFDLVTKWKTAATSLLAARRLAPPDVRRILIIGAGTVARSMREAYGAAFPTARFVIWNRTFERADALAGDYPDTVTADDRESAVVNAQIVATATMSSSPVLQGEWLTPGTHVDLIGAYKADMREADDAVLTRGALFVDSRATTIEHIGELSDPISRGVIAPEDVRADFGDIATGAFVRPSDDAITVCKNGGGAHLDLMTCRYILDALNYVAAA